MCIDQTNGVKLLDFLQTQQRVPLSPMIGIYLALAIFLPVLGLAGSLGQIR